MIDFFEFSNEMLCLANRDGYITRVNAAWTQTLGWTAEEITTRTYLDFVHPDDREATLREAAKLQTGEETTSFENRYLCKDGRYRWLAWQGKADPDSELFVGSARDITEQKYAELRYRNIYEQAPIGIALIDSHTGRFLHINPCYERIIGRTEAEMVQLTFPEISYPADLADDLENMNQLRAGTLRHFHLEKRLFRGDGSLMWASLTVVPMWQPGETPTCHLAMVEDITQRRATADALRESEERFRAFMNNTLALAWAKDELGRYVYLNPAYETRFKLGINDWWGKTDFELWPADIARKFWENDRQVLASGVPLQAQEESRIDGEEPGHWLVNKFVFQDEHQQRFVGGVGIDVSELKQVEESLRANQALLRNLIEVQEQERQLLCHEFHDGLMQYAFGAVMSLSSFRDKHPASEAAAVIDHAVAALRQGIDDGRRAIQGIRPAVLDDFGLAAAIDDLIDQQSKSGILITFKCDPTIGELPNELQTAVYRIVQEAINNARKYSDTDVIRIKLRRQDQDLLLEVLDFGSGFDVEGARQRGFGILGMTERVRLLGGECRIESQRDFGTQITARVPIPQVPV